MATKAKSYNSMQKADSTYKEETTMGNITTFLTAQAMYHICNKYSWFTAGDNEQYSKLFEMTKGGAGIHELALIIWICSEDKTIREIEYTLQQEALALAEQSIHNYEE